MSSSGREHILRAAIEAFSARGYDGTTTAAVARAAGVTQPLVHHHFGSKEGLFIATLDSLFEPLMARLRAAVLAASHSPPESWLRQLLDTVTRAMADEPALARLILIEGGRPGPGYQAIWKRWGGPLNDVIGPLADGAVARGQAPDVPRWMLVGLVLGACSRPFQEVNMIRDQHDVDPLQPEAIDAYAELVADVLVAGLAATAAARD